MSRTISINKALCITAMTLALGGVAHATTALRTFVSGTGSDSNTSSLCAVATPCRTLQAALSVTTVPGGEIDAQNAAGYGSLSSTITGTLTILGVPGAAISVPNGGTGITINASGSFVIINSFQINGNSAGNNTGIALTAGTLILENSALKLLATGMTVASGAIADLQNTDVQFNATGISTTGTGSNTVSFPTTYSTTQVRINGGSVLDNTIAFTMNNPGTYNGGNSALSTILLSDPQSTNTAGNATWATCPPLSASDCTNVMPYSLSYEGTSLDPTQ